jgi:tetratricopeptide (TPR) repeat protein
MNHLIRSNFPEKIRTIFPFFNRTKKSFIFAFRLTGIFFLFTFPIWEVSAQVIEEELVFAFPRRDRMEAERMVVVGEVVSIEKAEFLETTPNSDLNLDTRPDNIVVKVLNPRGVRVGQVLYLVEKHPDHRMYRNGSVVGEMKVQSIFDTTFFGKQLRGQGFTRLIENRPMTVVRKLESGRTDESLLAKKKGDTYFYQGKIAEAMKEYKKAISLDPGLADPHFALANVYRKEGKEWTLSALGEMEMAWKYRENFQDKRDKHQFYYHQMAFFREVIEDGGIPQSKLESMLVRILDSAKESDLQFGAQFETAVYRSYAFYGLYMSGNPNLSKNYELAKEWIEIAEKKNKNSLLFHSMAILIYAEDLKDWNPLRPKTERISQSMDKIRNHGKILLRINPPGNPIPDRILTILEKIE